MFDRASLSEQVEIALKNEITSGRMQPGQRISTTDLRAAWNISSTPFRDAVRALEIQGFVIVEARKGVFVAPLDAKAVSEIFDLRIALECIAIERATLFSSHGRSHARFGSLHERPEGLQRRRSRVCARVGPFRA